MTAQIRLGIGAQTKVEATRMRLDAMARVVISPKAGVRHSGL